MYRWAKFLPLFALAAVPHVHASALLDSALQPWLQERDAWAFTQHVREFDKEGVKAERVERYDPSLPEMTRWTLLELNGHAPTLAEASAFTQKKGRNEKNLGR